ncbi:MAG: hypothetical protein ACYCVN_04740 [Acidimicrobiales bacterium]
MHESGVTVPGRRRTQGSTLVGLAGTVRSAAALVVIAVIFAIVMVAALGVAVLSLTIRALVPHSSQPDRVRGGWRPGAVIDTTARVIRSAGPKSTR